MEEDNEYLKLPVDEQCVHKLWKARVLGYEKAAKLFQQLDDEKSPEFSKYLGLIKKFVVDSNAVAQEKGLEAALAFVENSAVAGKTVGEVMNGVVSKCIAAPKTKTKELAVQVTLMYIEIEKYEAVQEELLKGMEHKNPKIMAACVTAVTLALREFGTKIINIKPLVKKVPVLLEDRDKAVRDEGKAMAIEMYRWIGAALQPQLKDLKPVQVTELEAEFQKVKGERAVPTRYIRSQQQKQATLVATGGGGGDGDGGDGNDICDAPEEIDPYDLMDPVDILSKLPKDFYEKVEAKKWQERKEAMEILDKLLETPKLENGDYGDLVRALKKIITKDTNVMVIASAAKCLSALANGLKKRFQPYASACIPAILEKFREKKQNVVIALKEAIDGIFISTTLEAIQEDVLAALENKNPSVKAETAAFLARSFTKCTPNVLNKKILKAYTSSLLKLLNDPDPTVRDNSAEALGTAMKVVGEKAITPFMADIEAIKKSKIKECCDKAVIIAKVSVPKASDRPNTAPAAVNRNDAETTSNALGAQKANKRVASAATKKTAPKKQAASTTSGTRPEKFEREMTTEEAEQKAAEIFPEDVLSGLSDTNWKTRLSSVETFVQVVSAMEPAEIPSQVMIHILNRKPGLKDTNFQVLKARLEALKLLAEISKLSSTSVEACVVDVAEKLGDAKNGALAAEVLTSLAEASKLDLVGTLVLDFAFNQKSPKVQQEALAWLSNAIREFGFVIQPKGIVEQVKKALAATLPAVRSAGIQFLGTLYIYMGPQLAMLFENEKASLRQQIQAEFDKHVGETPPIPTRGARRNISEDQDEGSSEPSPEQPDLNVHELMPRVDISSHITESLLSELRDKNWKVRNEALQKLENILKENKYVTSNLGELPVVLAQRILDSNSNIAKTAIAFSQILGVAMGSQCKNQVHVIFPALLQSLSDNKQWIRSAAVSCINAWGEQCGYKEFFKNEMVADALKSDSPNLRTELWSWLAEKLPELPPKSIPKEELQLCVPYLYANLEDRNADVRKNAQECVLPFMLHLNYVPMAKAADKMKPASKSTIVLLLEKVRGSMPVKQLSAPAKQSANEEENAKTVKTAGAKAAAANKVAGKGKPVAKAGARKKDDDADTSPVLQNNNLKHQRTIDEQKLKVLKWNFTTPREEFVELLKDQMTNAGVNKNLLANMFHSDFRYHLKAIDTLCEDLPGNGGATKANLDLILKWMTLRFFDTNPSVLLKGLEYLQLVFAMLIEEEYNMFENEAASFIPYLILKIGDPKDAVRNSVRGLFKQMEKVYPLTKLFGYIMEGLKSKNARQRTECLDLLGSLIEVYGVSVCNPSPSAALKEIAKQISDRDNSVRNAALNCVVQAYFLEGEKVYKMVGQVSDKDLCLLEERIKRAAKNRPSRPVAPVSKTQHQQQVQQPAEPPPNSKMDTEENNQEEYSDNEDVAPPPIMRNIVPKPRPVSGPFGLDTKLLEQIERETLDLSAPKLQNFDLAELWESPVNIPKTAFCGLGSKRDSALPTALITAQPRQLEDSTTSSQAADFGIAKVASCDLNIAWQANVQMEAMLNSDKATALLGKEDSLIEACCVQLKLLHGNTNHDDNLAKGYRTLLMLIIEFFNHKNLCNNVSEDALIELVENLLMLLVTGRVESFGEGNCYIRIINTILLRIIEFANHTNTTCTFLQILHKCAGSDHLPARFEELTLKCLWRLIKFLPDWEGNLDVPMVLQKIHNFLKDYPSAIWKKRECDNPIRTVKTILHTITKMVGGERILQYASRIDNLGESELQPYLHRLVKKIKFEELKSKSKKAPHRLSKVTHEQLSEIFKKIGARETSQEGLELLYDFREQHPEADIEPFLKKSSQFFQDYIERNLKIIHDKRKSSDDNCYNFKSISTTTSMSSLGMQESGGPGTPFSEGGDATIVSRAGYGDHSRNIHSHLNEGDLEHGTKGVVYYLERLRTLQAQAGINPSSALDALKMQNNLGQGQTTHEQDLIKQQIQDDLEVLHTQSHTISNAGDNVTATGIEELRKRLELVKTSKR